MGSPNELTSHIVEALGAFASEEHPRVLNELIARAIKPMSIYQVLELRCAIKAALDPDIPIVAAALNLIDGQIALREIAAGEPWR